MTAAMSTEDRRRLWRTLVVILAAALVVALVAGSPPGEGQPLDPSSTGDLGTKGLVLLLRHEGAVVDVTDVVPSGPANGSTALVLSDQLRDEQREALRSWVGHGGTLVVADPRSPLAGATGIGSFGGSTLFRNCGLPALREANRLSFPSAVLSRPPSDATACYTAKSGAYLVAQADGSGTRVSLGGAGPFVNHNLGRADNSVLAVSLLAPHAGTTLHILRPARVGGGRRSIFGLISSHLRAAFWQLLVAFVIVCLWRGRRLGRPVLEPHVVEIPGSELVVAVGNLLQEGRRRPEARQILRQDLRRTLSERLSLPRHVDDATLADVAAARAGLDRDAIYHALTGPPPTSEAALVALAQSTESVRQEVVHAR